MTNNEVAAIRPDALAGAAVLAKAISVGEGKASMSTKRSFVLAMLAGLFIGIGGMFMTLVKSDATLGFAASSVLGGLAFSLGLFAVLVAGAELFTGNNLMVQGWLSKRYSTGALLRSWLVVYAGNFVGSLLLVCLLRLADFGGMGAGAVGTTMVNVAAGKCALPWGVAFGLAAAVLYATVILMNKRITRVSGIDRTIMQFAAAALVLLPYVLMTTGARFDGMTPLGWACLMCVGLLHSGVAYVLYFSALRTLPGQEAAILSYIDPLVAVLISLTVLGEPVTALQMLGGAMILAFTLANEIR